MPGEQTPVLFLLQVIVIFLAMVIVIMTLSWYAHTRRTAEQADLLNQIYENQALLLEVIRDILQAADEANGTPALESDIPDCYTREDLRT